MSNRDLQTRLLAWIQDERHKAEAEAYRFVEGGNKEYFDGMADAYRSCFAKVVEMIDIAKERENGLG